MVFDTTSAADRHAQARLAAERVIWLTTVTPGGQPQTFPVWFVQDGADLLVYSDNRAKRLANIAANPNVTLHLDGGKQAYDLVIIEGTARIDTTAPALPDHTAYCARYADWIAASFGSPTGMAEHYNVPVRITPVRGRASAPAGSAPAEGPEA